jgi:hypothetical protein
MSIGQTHTHSTTCTEYDSEGNALITETVTKTIKLEGVETVKITTGAFTACLKFTDTVCDPDCGPKTTVWLAPGIGKVKSSNIEEVNELISYTNGFQTYHPQGLATFKGTPLSGVDEHGSKAGLVDYSFHKPTTVNIGTGSTYHWD